MRTLVLGIFTISCLWACQSSQHKVKSDSIIDSTLQVNTTSILKSKLSELNALSGQAIVMEAQTGNIKAMIGLERKDSADYQSCENFSQAYESALMHPISILSALETGKVKLTDTVDVGDGIYICKGDTIKDHNWHRGGYGKITVEQGFGVASNIANYKIVKKVFENEQAFSEALAKYGYQVKDTSLVYNPLGYGILTTPLQNLTFFNYIAKSKTAIKEALEYSVSNGLAKPAQSDKVKVAGATGTIQLPNGEYAVEFCGYFPADNPKYSVIVTINKTELPASGGLMAGDVFRQIVDIMNER